MDFDITLWKRLKEDESILRKERQKETLVMVKDLLKGYFEDKKVERVFLLGSILKEGAFYPFSDVDVAVEGFNERYFRTLRELEELLGREVDLIELEESRLKSYVEKEGLRIR